MGNSTLMSTRLHFPLYCRGTNRNCPGQLFSRYYASRHILRRCPLPLCSLDRGRICHRCRLRPLIPLILRIHAPQHLNQNPLRGNVCWCKYNFLPTTFPGAGRNTSPILRLPRRLHPLKHSFFHWLNSLPNRSNYIFIYYLRSIRR